MNNLGWYMNLYYKFRDYPIAQINNTHNANQLKTLYTSLIKKLFNILQLDNKRDAQIQGIISKNNYDQMANQRLQSHLQQQDVVATPLKNKDHEKIEMIIQKQSSGKMNAVSRMRQSICSNLNQKSLQSQNSIQLQNRKDSQYYSSSKWLVEDGPNQKNIDVFYELMIKMIRVSFRRLTIQTFAIAKFGRQLSKQAFQQITNRSDYQILKQKLSYDDIQQRSFGSKQQLISILQIPNSIENMKFQFLKYCIKGKIYNNPKITNIISQKSLNSQQSLLNSSQCLINLDEDSNQSKSIPLIKKQKSYIVGQSEQKHCKQNQQQIISNGEIQDLIMKVSCSQIEVFNTILSAYYKQIRKNNNNYSEVIGIRNIFQNIYEMTEGNNIRKSSFDSIAVNKDKFRKILFQEDGRYDIQSPCLTNTNILVATWFDLILFNQSPTVLYSIIQQLIVCDPNQNPLIKNGVNHKKNENGTNQSLVFFNKISSYLHLLILNSTKNIFMQSLCKINYMLIILQDVIGTQNNKPSRLFSSIKLSKYQIKNGQNTHVYEHLPITIDAKTQKHIWKQNAIQLLLEKWKIIANVVTQLATKNKNIFFANVFEECAKLFDEQLSLQIKLVEQLMNTTVLLTSNMNSSAKEEDKSMLIKKTLSNIIKQIIGFGSFINSQGESNGNNEKMLNIDGMMGFKGEKQKQGVATFSNREEFTEELSKWNQIINQNIYIYQQYLINLSVISKLFKNNQIYIALWFSKFHSETKILINKVEIKDLKTIFMRFNRQIPILFESMTNNNQNQLKNPKKREKSKFRGRLSSIKSQKSLNLLQKKAITLNYLLKAQLQLYFQYTTINFLVNQRNVSQIFISQNQNFKVHSNPEFLNNKIITNMLLFTIKTHQTQQLNQPKSNKIMDSALYYKQNKQQNIDNKKSQKTIQKGQINIQIQNFIHAINQFQQSINITLDLQQNWKQKYDEQKIDFLSQLVQYIRYLNQINYLHQFWDWIQTKLRAKQETTQVYDGKKNSCELLNGQEYKHDLDYISSQFQYIKSNYLHHQIIYKKINDKSLAKEQIFQMLKCLKSHNKELYMINETILSAEKYYKLIDNNLIGKPRSLKFKENIIEHLINHYKNQDRQACKIRIIEQIKENQMQQPFPHELSIESEVRCSTTYPLNVLNRHFSRNQSIKHQSLLLDSMKQGSKHDRQSKTMKKSTGKLISNFELTPQYYKILCKLMRLNSLIASFEINNNIYRGIKYHQMLSQQRVSKLSIIGNRYYLKIEQLISKNKEICDEFITQEILVQTKNAYQQKLLTFIITIITLNYNLGNNRQKSTQFISIGQKDTLDYSKVLSKYSQIIKIYISNKIAQNINRIQEREELQKNQSQNISKETKFNICRFAQQILQLKQQNSLFNEDSLLEKLQNVIGIEKNVKFITQFRQQFEIQQKSLMIYQRQTGKVQYLRKRLSYLLMREMYFILNYDNNFLESKLVNSKKNYMIYQQRIIKFYQDIINLDYCESKEKKQEQIKKRSIHLKGYQFKYEDQPPLPAIQKNLNQLICCLFNNLMEIYTSSIQFKMFTQNNSSSKRQNKLPIYNQYNHTLFVKQKQKIEVPLQNLKISDSHQNPHQIDIISIFDSIYQHPHENKSEVKSDSQLSKKTSSLQADNQIIQVYTPQKYTFNQSLALYLQHMATINYQPPVLKNAPIIIYPRGSSKHKNQPITQMELILIKNNENTLIAIMKSELLKKISQSKCNLIRKNLISNIQKLYINIDVRHKVFQSFKDKITNYELQKTKIYHQYMDYIRGLKLDVYSHLAGQSSLPYIKVIQSLKAHRLNIKKMQLQQRVKQQFQKNLQKWNIGIQQYIVLYDDWLLQQEKQYLIKNQSVKSEKKQLLQIYHLIKKQKNRQINNQLKLKKKKKCQKQQLFKVNLLNSQISKTNIIDQIKHNVQQKPFYVNIKKGNPSYQSKVNCIGAFQKKPINLQTVTNTCTKAGTRYQKITTVSKSQKGFKGLSMKYDVSKFIAKKAEQIQKKERMTEFNMQSIKTPFQNNSRKNQLKRHLSAPKIRPAIVNT